MILTKKQVKQIRRVFKENKDVGYVRIVEEGKTGIGMNMYVEYETSEGDKNRDDITDYESW